MRAVVAAILLCCALAAAEEATSRDLETRRYCVPTQIDWNLQGSPQPCSCEIKVFILSDNSITVAFKTRVYATQVKVYLAPRDLFVTPYTPTNSTTPTTTSSTTTTPAGPTTTFGNIFGRGDPTNGILEVQLIGSNGQVVSIYDVQPDGDAFFDGSSNDCAVLTITPPALPFRVQKIKLISTNDYSRLPVRGVKLFGFSDQPAPTTQVASYFFTEEGSVFD